MQRIGLAALIGVCGVLVMSVMQLEEGGHFRGPGDFVGRFLLPTFFSGSIAGWLLVPLLRGGNWVLTLCVALLATFLGALIGGGYVAATTHYVPLGEGAIIGAIFIWPLLWYAPWACVVWLGCLIVLRRAARRYSLK